MSEDTPTQSGDLGPMPDPEIEPGEPTPGGADAQPEDDTNEPADLAPEDNPAVEETPEPELPGAAEGADATENAEAEQGDSGSEGAYSPDTPAEAPDDDTETESAPGEEGVGEPTA